MSLVAASAVFLALLVFIGFQLSLILSGSQHIRNSYDAGILNVATRAVDIKLKPSGGDEAQFQDCTDSSGQIGLLNINRVFGKQLLINANAADMTQSGQQGQGLGHARAISAAADSLMERLANNLKSGQLLAPFFNAVQSQFQAQLNFSTAFVHRGDESNLSLSLAQIPAGAQFSAQNVVNKDGRNYFAGYKPISINGQSILFVAFRQNEMPHLISLEEFNDNTQAAQPVSITTSVPNAFFASGWTKNPSVQSAASAVANPQQTYRLAIPHAFVHLLIEPTQAKWLVNGKPVAESLYAWTSETQWKVQSYDVKCAKLNGYASVGNEYAKNNLWVALNALPGQHAQAIGSLLQRLQEIDPSMTAKKLEKLLSNQQLIPNTYDYIIYPTYNTPDATNPQMKVAALNNVAGSPWLNTSAVPDGTERVIGQESMTDGVDKNWGQVMGAWQLTNHTVQVDGQLLWTPGTGYGQCLGLLRVHRSATISFTGKCP